MIQGAYCMNNVRKILLTFGVSVVLAMTQLGHAQFQTLNPTPGGTPPAATNGIRVLVGPNTQLQIYREDVSQVYSGQEAGAPVDPISQLIFNGVYLAVDNIVFGPSSIDVAAGNDVDILWTQIGQSAVTGTGTVMDPYSVTTVVAAGTTGVQVELTTEYVSPRDFFEITARVNVPATNTANIKLYHVIDTYLSGGDNGPAYREPAVGVPEIIGVRKDNFADSIFEVFVQGNRAWDRWFSGPFNQPFTELNDGGNLSNTEVADPTTDNGMAVEWDLGSPQGEVVWNYKVAFTNVTGICGDRTIEGIEICDDGNIAVMDGCNELCVIEPGWECPVPGQPCIDVDECARDLAGCSVNATCANLTPGFTCTCDAGFEGDGFICTDIDECMTGANDCGSNATCINTPGAFDCQCDTGYTGDGRTCRDVDECVLMMDNCDANATCQNNPGAFLCECNMGYAGDGVTCTDIDECALNADDCDSNATCTNLEPGFSCACNTGFTGDGKTCDQCDCVVGDLCLRTGETDPMDACQICMPNVSSMQLTEVPGCRPCVDDTTCMAPTPACNVASGGCVQCINDSYCPDNRPTCGDNFVCRGCLVDSECENDLFCDVGTGVCGACSQDSQCEARNADLPVCNAGTCVRCMRDEQCPSDERCDAATNQCTSDCGSDADCAGSTTPICDAGTCVGCLLNEHCPSGICDLTTKTCAAAGGCASDPDCTNPNAPVCLSGMCVECTSTNKAACDMTQPACDDSINMCSLCTPTDPGICPTSQTGTQCLGTSGNYRCGCRADVDCLDGRICDIDMRTCVTTIINETTGGLSGGNCSVSPSSRSNDGIVLTFAVLGLLGFRRRRKN